MGMPTMLYVTLSKVDQDEAPRLCICSPNEELSRAADIKVETRGLAHGQVLSHWSGTEYRCPDGASLIVDEFRRQARLLGVPFWLYDNTGGVFSPGELVS